MQCTTSSLAHLQLLKLIEDDVDLRQVGERVVGVGDRTIP